MSNFCLSAIWSSISSIFSSILLADTAESLTNLTNQNAPTAHDINRFRPLQRQSRWNSISKVTALAHEPSRNSILATGGLTGPLHAVPPVSCGTAEAKPERKAR